MRSILSTLGLILWIGSAHAQFSAAMLSGNPTTPPLGGYVGPGDTVGSATVFWGTIAYSTAKAAAHVPMATMIRTSDSHSCNALADATTGLFGNTGSCSTGGENGTAVSSWCAATTCNIVFLDQISTNNTVLAAGQTSPTATLSCVGSVSCVVFNGTSDVLRSPSMSLSHPFTIVAIAKRTGNLSVGQSIAYNETTFIQADFAAAAAQAQLYSGASLFATAADNAEHILQFVSGTSGAINVDGTQTTGDAGTSDIAGEIDLGGAFNSPTWGQFMTGNIIAVGIWPGAFTPTNQTNMCHTLYTIVAVPTPC